MKLKRIQHRENGGVHVAIEHDGEWHRIENAADQDLLNLLTRSANEFETATYSAKDYEEILPFQPAAYRDFMLYETHAINAARGFVKKYRPKLLPLINLYERTAGQVFPKLKPSRRYYQHPIYYMGNHLNFITNGQSIKIPAYTRELDYELEIAAVINKPLLNASEEEALDAICGFVILNDFSARDVQLDEMKSGFGPVKAKNFGNAISAVVVSKDALLDSIDQLNVRVRINDTLVSESVSVGKLYSFQQAIAYASWEEALHPGELFGSGTIPGCCGIENGRMLNKGDRITLEVDCIGSLSNTIYQNLSV